MDRLPANVIEEILGRLPILDAIRTSFLSNGWRHRWKSISNLVFDSDSFPLSEDEEEEVYDRKIVKIIDRVLLSHKGFIHKFMHSTFLRSSSDVDLWISIISTKGVEEITLKFWVGDLYEVPSYLFHCETVKCLRLSNCMVNLPPTFKGLSNLVILDLEEVICLDCELECLISSCTLLRKLVLENIDVCSHLILCTANLRDLTLAGSFDYVDLQNTPMLAVASFNWSNEIDEYDYIGQDSCNLIEVFGGLSCVEKLQMFGNFLPFLATGSIYLPERLPVTCDRLRDISMHVDFGDLGETMVTLCLFRSCPVLEILEISHHTTKVAAGVPSTNFWEAQGGPECKFNCLKIVKLTRFGGLDLEMVFIKSILANTPMLENINIKLHAKVSRDVSSFKRVSKELMSFPRASPKARMILVE